MVTLLRTKLARTYPNYKAATFSIFKILFWDIFVAKIKLRHVHLYVQTSMKSLFKKKKDNQIFVYIDLFTTIV